LSDTGELPAADVQATLCALTARTVADAVNAYAAHTSEIFVCGGGAHNGALLKRIARALPGVELGSTQVLGVGPDWVEAATFAWLAARCIGGQPGNLPTVTGARKAVVLGAVYPGRS
jgi:anhydro-N-acetylmuramic acid kinase